MCRCTLLADPPRLYEDRLPVSGVPSTFCMACWAARGGGFAIVGMPMGGMPVGMQLLGNYFQEARLLNAAHRFQQATDWHARKPEGF